LTKLCLKDVAIYRAKHCVLNTLNAQVSAGEIIALIGANGAGKSTLLHGIVGLIEISGAIFFDGEDLKGMNRRKKASLLTLLLQSAMPHPYCLAESRIAQGLVPLSGFRAFLDSETSFLIEQCARELNIAHLLTRPLSKMSGGELRLVNIAKCLVNHHTKLILLDEPSVFLDFAQKEILAKNLLKRATAGALILFSSHDRSFIESTASRVLALSNGNAHLMSVKEFFKSG